MIRLSTLSGYGLSVAAAAALFWTSQTVQKAQDRLEKATHELARESESLHVLRAEWDYLNRPDRIEMLAQKYLGMQPAGTGALIADADEIPPPALAETEFSGSGLDAAQAIALASIAPAAGARR
ncbi:MAG: hypothetical protein H6862_04375 [Rhodospirillales bacterium]|nr:hypothetical protein [Rhodospirillales bacterium]